MAKTYYKHGSATYPVGLGIKCILHSCSDTGSWCTDSAKALSRRWMKAEKAYRNWFRNRHMSDFHLGETQTIFVGPDIYIINMIVNHGYSGRSNAFPMDSTALEACLSQALRFCRSQGATVHLPRFDPSTMGGDWYDLEDLLVKVFVENGVDVFIYDSP